MITIPFTTWAACTSVSVVPVLDTLIGGTPSEQLVRRLLNDRALRYAQNLGSYLERLFMEFGPPPGGVDTVHAVVLDFYVRAGGQHPGQHPGVQCLDDRTLYVSYIDDWTLPAVQLHVTLK